jgi:predicted nucleic acid-binding protein
MAVLQTKMRNAEYRLQSRAVLRFAREHRCSAYDAEYGVLAEQLDVPLITWDESLLRALPSRALTPEAFVGRK